MAEIFGTSRNDTLSGAADGGDTMFGLGGDDLIYGAEGDDSLLGGEGRDTLAGGNGSDTLLGEAGDDALMIIATQPGEDFVDGGDGVDTLDLNYSFVFAGVHLDFRTDQNVVTLLPSGDSFVHMERLNFYGGDGRDVVIGGQLSDTIFGSRGDDRLNGQRGDDALTGDDGDDRLVGSLGDDSLYGREGDDTMLGGAGDDYVGWSDFYDDGADVIDGGAGVDLISIVIFDDAPAFSIDLRTNQTVAAEIVDGATFIGMERISFYGGSGDDFVYGGQYGDMLSSGAGRDTLFGADGDDTMTARYFDGGADQLDGGAGTDRLTLNYTAFGGAVVVDFSGGAPSFSTSDGSTFLGFEILNLYGGAGGDQVTGSRFADILQGYGGDDSLSGGRGSDVLRGGLGADTMFGGEGNDVVIVDRLDAGPDSIDGGAGLDRLVLDKRTSVDAIVLDIQDSQIPQALADGTVVVGIERFQRFAGGSGDDVVGGGALADLINGGDGDDSLTGREGNDTLIGSRGADTLTGGDGDDAFRMSYGEGPDSIDGGGGTGDILEINLGKAPFGVAFDFTPDDSGVTTLADGSRIAGVERFIIYGREFAPNDITGSSGDDLIVTLYGSDRLSGGDGDDTLVSGNGQDTLTGGDGADVFVIGLNVAPNRDTVTDFVSDDGDRLQFSPGPYGLGEGRGLEADGSLSADYFAVGAAATANHAQFLLRAEDGALLFDPDGVGGKAAVVAAQFAISDGADPADFLHAGDFVFV